MTAGEPTARLEPVPSVHKSAALTMSVGGATAVRGIFAALGVAG
jgi:hypothetical protein